MTKTNPKGSFIDRHPVRFYTLIVIGLVVVIGGCFFASGGRMSNAVRLPSQDEVEAKRTQRRAERAMEQLLEIHDQDRRESAPYVRPTP